MGKRKVLEITAAMREVIMGEGHALVLDIRDASERTGTAKGIEDLRCALTALARDAADAAVQLSGAFREALQRGEDPFGL